MPYKIYTYEDPYRLDQADFWEEISGLPHFCVARTLANGLRDVYGDKIKGLLCPLDAFVEHEKVYKQWTDNIGLQVQQYSALTTAFDKLRNEKAIGENFHKALVQNQTHFLNAIRLFVELDISADSIDADKGNAEQRLFVSMLRRAQASSLFRFPSTPGKEALKVIAVELAKKEVTDCKGDFREKRRCERAVTLTEQQPFEAVVVHGVHQFTPAQLRLLISMEKMGITVIFLYNYQKKYSKIYSSWHDIYDCFGVELRHDSAISEHCMPAMQNPSNALACALGSLCENGRLSGTEQLRQWHKLYKDIDFIEFANITEYAHFVSDRLEVAINKYSESRGVMQRGNGEWNYAAVLYYLDEQVYTANRDVHTLLNLYYPEYARDRHFLSYPIGQFFSAVYRLWDYETGEIRFDIPAIKECLNSNILTAARGEELLRTFYNLEPIFEQITTFTQFRRAIASDYVSHYEEITKAKSTDGVHPLKQLAVYNKYKVRKQDVLALVKAIEEINEIAAFLFSLDESREDYISFGKHFHNLEEFLKQRELTLANEQERALIMALQLRLEKIKPERSTFSGTFRDLKQGLHFYLKQKNDEDRGVDWIVKNFEQIDGDILQSQRQFKDEQKKTYHFACLSDRDMNKTVNDLLPWPLTEEFIRIAYSPVDLQFQVYYTALSERSNFLRYALFYGLCFNRCDVRLSYVKQYGDESTEPYSLFSILGLKAGPGPLEEELRSDVVTLNIQQNVTKGVPYDRFQMMDMFLCPYRFFLDYVLDDAPVVQGKYLSQKFFENLLIEGVWKRISRKQREQVLPLLDRVVEDESKKIEPYFSFWKQTEIHDLKLRARNYLYHEIVIQGSEKEVRPYAPSHMKMRKLFGAAKFAINIAEMERKHPYPGFEALASRDFLKKYYSLHKLPNPENKPEDTHKADTLRAEVKEYINQTRSKDKSAIPSDWCTYCVHKGICMEPYLSTEK